MTHLPPVRWPSPRDPPPACTADRLFGDGNGFATPDGRARFVPTPYRPPAVAADEQWPLLLNTGRVRDQWHTMTRTGQSAAADGASARAAARHSSCRCRAA